MIVSDFIPFTSVEKTIKISTESTNRLNLYFCSHLGGNIAIFTQSKRFQMQNKINFIDILCCNFNVVPCYGWS